MGDEHKNIQRQDKGYGINNNGCFHMHNLRMQCLDTLSNWKTICLDWWLSRLYMPWTKEYSIDDYNCQKCTFSWRAAGIMIRSRSWYQIHGFSFLHDNRLWVILLWWRGLTLQFRYQEDPLLWSHLVTLRVDDNSSLSPSSYKLTYLATTPLTILVLKRSIVMHRESKKRDAGITSPLTSIKAIHHCC